ncbi:MAG: hypothetical protein ACE5QV_08295, partial [Fidelibacterota bacterium]
MNKIAALALSLILSNLSPIRLEIATKISAMEPHANSTFHSYPELSSSSLMEFSPSGVRTSSHSPENDE